MKTRLLLVVGLLVVLLLAACSGNDNSETQQEQDVEDTETTVEVASVTKDDLAITKQLYGKIIPESTTPVIPPAAGEVESLEVAKGDQVEADDLLAKITTARGTINVTAPAAGEITMLQAQEGDVVSKTEPIATIVALDQLLLRATVTPENLPLFEKEQEIPITIETTGLETSAQVTYVSNVTNETRLYPIEATIDNQESEIKPGMMAVMNVTEEVVKDMLLIPTTALVKESGTSFAYVVEEDKAVKTELTVIESQSDVTAIQGKGIEAGDSVVTAGQLTLSDGSKVTIAKEDS